MNVKNIIDLVSRKGILLREIAFYIVLIVATGFVWVLDGFDEILKLIISLFSVLSALLGGFNLVVHYKKQNISGKNIQNAQQISVENSNIQTNNVFVLDIKSLESQIILTEKRQKK